MKYKLAILFSAFFLSFNFILLEDQEDLPTVQAVCQAEMKNGEIYEGMITFGTQGETRYFLHGFYYQNYHPNSLGGRIIEFNFDRDSFSFFRNNTFYAENTMDLRPYPLENLNDSIVTNTSKEIYKLSKTIKLHQEMPKHMNIFSNLYETSNNETIEVNVSEIAVFRFVKNPSVYWIELIEKYRKGNPYLLNKNLRRGYKEPIWYHDIENDAELKKFVLQYFNTNY